MNRVGIVVDTVSEDFEYALTRIAEWHLSNIELFSLWGKNICDLTDVEASTAAGLVQRYRLRVTNIASLVMRCPPVDTAEREGLALFERAVKMARRFGTDRVRCYAFLKQQTLDAVWPRLLRVYEKLTALADQHQITLLLENSSYANLQYATELRRFLDAVPHPRLKLLWDAGNALAAGDPTPTVDAWHMLRDRIVHLHLKDSVAHGSTEWVPLGSGAFDLLHLLQALKTDGYNEIISLETYFDPGDTDREGKVYSSVKRLRQAMQSAAMLPG